MLGSNQKDLRDRNMRLVLTLLRERGALPKADVARSTGLSAQTVSVIIRALESDGLLVRGKKQKGKVGQPSVPMSLAPNGAHFIGIEIRAQGVELLIIDFVGQILGRARVIGQPKEAEELQVLLSEAAHRISERFEEFGECKVMGIGVALSSERLSMDWTSLPRVLGLSNACSVYVGTEAGSACAAELILGGKRSTKNFLYVHLGHRVGGGIVLDGSLQESPKGSLGNFPLEHQKKRYVLSDAGSLFNLVNRLSIANLELPWLNASDDSWSLPKRIVSDWLNDAVPAISRMVLGAKSIIDFPEVVIDGPMPNEVRLRIAENVAIQLKEAVSSTSSRPRVSAGVFGAEGVALGAASLPIMNDYMMEAK